MDEPEKRRRGRPLKDPANGPISAADRNWSYRRRVQAKEQQQASDLYRLAYEWCCFRRDLEHRDPALAAQYQHTTMAHDAAIRVLGAGEVARIFAREPISLTAQKHRDAEATARALGLYGDENPSEKPRNDFSPGDENALLFLI